MFQCLYEFRCTMNMFVGTRALEILQNAGCRSNDAEDWRSTQCWSSRRILGLGFESRLTCVCEAPEGDCR